MALLLGVALTCTRMFQTGKLLKRLRTCRWSITVSDPQIISGLSWWITCVQEHTRQWQTDLIVHSWASSPSPTLEMMYFSPSWKHTAPCFAGSCWKAQSCLWIRWNELFHELLMKLPLHEAPIQWISITKAEGLPIRFTCSYSNAQDDVPAIRCRRRSTLSGCIYELGKFILSTGVSVGLLSFALIKWFLFLFHLPIKILLFSNVRLSAEFECGTINQVLVTLFFSLNRN